MPNLDIQSVHRFTRPRIRLWLPLLMLVLILLCAWTAAPRISVVDFIALLFLLYFSVSSLVSVCEIGVTRDGLVIDRLLLPKRFVPWEAIDRVVVFAQNDGQTGAKLELASIGLYEGLSPLNRLPGPVYGQGFRQTIIIMPDALQDYDGLLAELKRHSAVIHTEKPR